jgi:hypothetical protein
MKKWLIAVCLFMFIPMTVSAHGGDHQALPQTQKDIEVFVNGIFLDSIIIDSKAYVSIIDFARLFGKTAGNENSNHTADFNGKKISTVVTDNGEIYAWIRDLSSAVEANKVTWNSEEKSVYVLILPEGTIQLDPHVVPAMGEHWANPVDLPTGPIYGVHEGKLVFIEYMISQEDFKEGKSFVNLPGMKGLPSPSIVQSDIEFVPNGHPGFEIPHYDMHHYFIMDEEQQKIK